MIDFYIEKVEVEGFLKYKERHEQTFQRHLTIITGPNASGKTSILEAVSFGLFGLSRVDNSKQLSMVDLIHKDKKEAKISLYFHYKGKSYLLKKSIKRTNTKKGYSSSFVLYENGRRTHIKVSDMFNFLQVTNNIAKRIIYSPQQELTAILTLDKVNKEKFFKEVLSLDIVDNILEILKKQKNKLEDKIEFFLKDEITKESLEVLEREIKELKNLLVDLQKKIEALKKLNIFFERKKEALDNLKILLEKKREIGEYKKLVEDLKKYFIDTYNLPKNIDYEDLEITLQNYFSNAEREFQKVKSILYNLSNKFFKLERLYFAINNINPSLEREFEESEREYKYLKENVYPQYLKYKNILTKLEKELYNLKKNLRSLEENVFKDTFNMENVEDLENIYKKQKLYIEKKLNFLLFVEKNLKDKFNYYKDILEKVANYNEQKLQNLEKEVKFFEKFENYKSQVEYLLKEIQKLKKTFDLEFIKSSLDKFPIDAKKDLLKNPREILLYLEEINENPIKFLKEAKKYLYDNPKQAEELIDKAILSLELRDILFKLKLQLEKYIEYLDKKKDLKNILGELGFSSLEEYKSYLKTYIQKKDRVLKEYENLLKIKYYLNSVSFLKKLSYVNEKIEKLRENINFESILRTLLEKYEKFLVNLKTIKDKLLDESVALEFLYVKKKSDLLKKEFQDNFKYSIEEFENIYSNIERKYFDLKEKYKSYKENIIDVISASSIFRYEDVEKNKELYKGKVKNILNIFEKLKIDLENKKRNLELKLRDKSKFEKLVKFLLALEERRKVYEENLNKFNLLCEGIISFIDEKLISRIEKYDLDLLNKYLEEKKKLSSSSLEERYEALENIFDLILAFIKNLLEVRNKEFLKVKEELALRKEKFEFIKNRLKELEKEKKKLNFVYSWMEDLENYKVAIKEEFLKNIPYLVTLYYNEIGFPYEVEINPDFSILIKDGNITRNVRSLSGGERVALALALKVALANFLNVPFLILDEPFEALDEDKLANAKAFLEKYFKNQILVATHTW